MELKHLFTKRFKEARKSQKLSQEKLGIEIGLDEFVASTRINRYENAIHMPDLATMQRIAKVLNVPVAYFFADDELAKVILTYHHNTK